VEEILLLIDTSLSCEDMARQICAMVPRWRFFWEFLGPAFPTRCVPHSSDLHSKFAHHVLKYGRHQFCDRCAETRRGEKVTRNVG